MFKNLKNTIGLLILVAINLAGAQLVQAAGSKIQNRVNISAHIVAESVANLKDTEWTLYKATAINSNEKVSKSNLISTKISQFKGAIKSISLAEGQYVLKARYGKAVQAKIFKIDPKDANKFLNIKIVFNLGGLKLNSVLGNDKDKIKSGIHYNISNAETGKVIIETDDVTNIIYLNEGKYNISADFKGILTTSSIVEIKPNFLNQLTFNHKIGAINLNIDNIINGLKSPPPIWHIVGAKNKYDKQFQVSVNSRVFLPSGDYKLTVETPDAIFSQDFGIHPAQVIEFKIPKN